MAGLVRSSRNVILLKIILISSVTPFATVVAPDVSMPTMMAPSRVMLKVFATGVPARSAPNQVRSTLSDSLVSAASSSLGLALSGNLRS